MVWQPRHDYVLFCLYIYYSSIKKVIERNVNMVKDCQIHNFAEIVDQLL